MRASATVWPWPSSSRVWLPAWVRQVDWVSTGLLEAVAVGLEIEGAGEEVGVLGEGLGVVGRDAADVGEVGLDAGLLEPGFERGPVRRGRRRRGARGRRNGAC